MVTVSHSFKIVHTTYRFFLKPPLEQNDSVRVDFREHCKKVVLFLMKLADYFTTEFVFKIANFIQQSFFSYTFKRFSLVY
jgi:hypothetical protein